MNSLSKLIYDYIDGNKKVRQKMFRDMGITGPNVGMKILEDILHERISDEVLEKLHLGIIGHDKELEEAIKDIKFRMEGARLARRAIQIVHERNNWRPCIIATFERYEPHGFCTAMALKSLKRTHFPGYDRWMPMEEQIRRVTAIAKEKFYNFNKKDKFPFAGKVLRLDYYYTYDDFIPLNLDLIGV